MRWSGYHGRHSYKYLLPIEPHNEGHIPYILHTVHTSNYLYFYLTPPGQLDTFVLCGVRLVCYLLGLGVPNGQGAHVWDVCV